VSYEVFVESDVHRARTRLPGNVRQRLRGFISSLAAEPRPHGSELLDAEGIDLPAGVEVRRYRLDPWRLVYAVNDESRWVWCLALRRRPPYDYEDLQELVRRIETE
jgi:mRNA-degrading endonuclease RelE of RelBE toxin-antitoxin system